MNVINVRLNWICIACLVLLVCIGCDGASSSADTSEQGESKADDHQADWPTVVRVGLVPTEGGADTQARFVPLRDHLRAELKTNVELRSASSYQGVITAMANQQLEFAWFGPKSYVEAAKRAGAEALLIELNREGEPGYRSIFIVPADSEITTLDEARGKRFAFTDQNSTSGCLIPSTLIFDKYGMPAEEYFSEVSYSGAHGTSILQVAAGELEIAATNDLDMAKLLQKGAVQNDALRIIYTSELIPGSPFACRSDIPESLKQAFSDAIMKLNDKPGVLEQLQNGGYELTTDDEYDIIRATQNYLKNQTEKPAQDPVAG